MGKQEEKKTTPEVSYHDILIKQMDKLDKQAEQSKEGSVVLDGSDENNTRDTMFGLIKHLHLYGKGTAVKRGDGKIVKMEAGTIVNVSDENNSVVHSGDDVFPVVLLTAKSMNFLSVDRNSQKYSCRSYDKIYPTSSGLANNNSYRCVDCPVNPTSGANDRCEEVGRIVFVPLKEDVSPLTAMKFRGKFARMHAAIIKKMTEINTQRVVDGKPTKKALIDFVVNIKIDSYENKRGDLVFVLAVDSVEAKDWDDDLRSRVKTYQDRLEEESNEHTERLKERYERFKVSNEHSDRVQHGKKKSDEESEEEILEDEYYEDDDEESPEE